MRKYFPAFVLLFTLAVFSLPLKSIAQDITAEGVSVPPTTSATLDATSVPTAESSSGKTAEAVSTVPSAETVTATGEITATATVTATATATVTAIASTTATAAAAATTTVPSTETKAIIPGIIVVAPPVEGSSYKGVPWGADFSAFKTIKGYAGNLGPQSAVLIGGIDDNDIALLLGVPVAGKDANGSQRVMFEYMPQKFAAIYFEPDDTYFIFYNGKFAMTFAYINSVNFDLYRDTFYKKYSKTGDLSKKYELGAKRYYQLQSGIFAKGQTEAFLIKSQLTNKKETQTTAKLVFAYNDLFEAIRKEITEKLAADKLSGSEKSKQQLLKDLNKIQ
jgi:hypothetical protein